MVKRLPVFLSMILAIVSLVWVAGCRAPESPSSGTNMDEIINRDESPNLNDAFGGFNMKDESPAFGDATLADDFADDVEFDDPISRLTDVRALDRPGRPQLYLMITWGNLSADSTIDHRTDWSGSLSIDPGVVLLKRTIRFELDDHILPRTQRDLIEWKSTTGRSYDGILVKLMAKPQPNSSAADTAVDSSQVVIKFDTDVVDVELTLDQIPNINKTITLPDGNAVAFNAVHVPPHACPHGFLHGAWRNDPERQGGVFYGRWATEGGKLRGHLKGIYGVNDEGKKVFYGKMISENGRFEGIMRGTYDAHPGDADGGWFAGRWVDRHLNVKGGLKGEWRHSSRCQGGFFRGVWAANCLQAL